MKILAWVMVGLGLMSQLFFSFSNLILPSMASAEGVAVYPPAVVMIGGFLYRILPYAIFATVLLVADRRFPRMTVAIYLAVTLAVISPLLIAFISLATPLTASQFREWFWPFRPAIQIALFIVLVAFGWLAGSLRAKTLAA